MAELVHSFIGCARPQSKQPVVANWVEQCGQTAWDWNVSKDFWHFEQRQNSPSGGDVLQDGQKNPPWRGNFARRSKARACCIPLQQFITMKTERTPNQAN